MASTNKAITYCNRALVDLGENPITSFTDGSAAARVGGVIYEGIVEELLSYSRWEFATIQAQLARIATTPLFGWEYAYTLPTTPRFLRMVRMARTSDSLVLSGSLVWPRMSRPDFAIRALEYPAEQFNDVLMSNYGEVFIEYVGRVDETLFPPAFEACVVTRLSEAFAMSLTDNPKLVAFYHEKLHGEPRRAGQIGRAVHYDRTNSPRPGLQDDAGLISGR